MHKGICEPLWNSLFVNARDDNALHKDPLGDKKDRQGQDGGDHSRGHDQLRLC